MYAAGLLSQETGAGGACFAANSQMMSGSLAAANDFYFSGSLFGGKYPAFGANLTLEEIADRYGLSE